MDSLVHQLDTYSRLGIPRVPHHMQLTHAPITLQDDDEVEEGKFVHESELIDQCTLSKYFHI